LNIESFDAITIIITEALADSGSEAPSKKCAAYRFIVAACCTLACLLHSFTLTIRGRSNPTNYDKKRLKLKASDINRQCRRATSWGVGFTITAGSGLVTLPYV
jgi:hypothetical protein